MLKTKKKISKKITKHKNPSNNEINDQLLNETINDSKNQVFVKWLQNKNVKNSFGKSLHFYGKISELNDDQYMVEGNDNYSTLTFKKSDIDQIDISKNPRSDLVIILKA